ncbi:MAG: hypothetical protein ACAI34_04315 [Verrucomicrobium sp.]
MKLSLNTLNLAAVPLLLATVVPGWAQGQSNEALEVREARATLQISAARINDLESRLTKAKDQVNSLAESLASANGESQQTRSAYEKLRVQMEGLGIAALDASNAELQQRLLTALSDLRLLETQKRAMADALVNLSEASLAFANAAGNVAPEAKRNLGDRLADAGRAMNQLKAQGDTAVADLQNARVVSLKDDLGIAILNVGSRHGVHPGMPFSLYRQDKPIARAVVVDVRSGICGAVVQELINNAEPVKVGDTGKVEAMKG